MVNRPTPAKAVPVRVPPDLVARIDALKGELVPREAYVRVLLTKAVEAEERKAAKR
jgi:hypothetical protein